MRVYFLPVRVLANNIMRVYFLPVRVLANEGVFSASEGAC